MPALRRGAVPTAAVTVGPRLRAARTRIASTVAALAATVALAGCGLGAGKAPTGVSLLVSREFGAKHVLSLSSPKADGSETVMSLLMRNAKVGTRYGGGFVESVDGHAGGQDEGQPVNWFYYVNGVQAEKGAAATNVHPGDRIWWDLHNWVVAEQIPDVVGSFPAPFSGGPEGKRMPVRMECTDPQSGPCQEVAKKLIALGVPAAFAAIGPSGESSETITLLVGTWAQLRPSPPARMIEQGPAVSGVFARVQDAGQKVELLGKTGSVSSTLGAGSGLVAATRYSQEGPAWVVAGTDQAGLALAARSFDAKALDGHFAVAVVSSSTGPKVLPLPQEGG